MDQPLLAVLKKVFMKIWFLVLVLLVSCGKKGRVIVTTAGTFTLFFASDQTTTTGAFSIT